MQHPNVDTFEIERDAINYAMATDVNQHCSNHPRTYIYSKISKLQYNTLYYKLGRMLYGKMNIALILFLLILT